MARTTSHDKHAARENEILDAALVLIQSKGYEQMTIQDILDELQISKGAFYHYFRSKRALLQAVIARMADQMMTVLRPIVEDTGKPALAKLEAVFQAGAVWKSARMDAMIGLLHAWYADDNALVRDKLSRASLNQFRPVLGSIIEQGISPRA